MISWVPKFKASWFFMSALSLLLLLLLLTLLLFHLHLMFYPSSSIKCLVIMVGIVFATESMWGLCWGQTVHFANFSTKGVLFTIITEVAILAVPMHTAAIIVTPLTILARLAQIETVDAAFFSVFFVASFPFIPFREPLHHWQARKGKKAELKKKKHRWRHASDSHFGHGHPGFYSSMRRKVQKSIFLGVGDYFCCCFTLNV